MDEATQVEGPLKTSVSIPAISKVCLSHLETVEEETALCGLMKLTMICVSFVPQAFRLMRSLFNLLLTYLYAKF